METFSSEINLEELKKQWDSIVVEKKSEAELMKMTQAHRIPRIRKLMMKLILEISISLAVVVAIILIGYWRGTSLWLTAGCMICNAFFLFNNILGFRFLRIFPHEDSIRANFEKHYLNMRKMITLSNIAGSVAGLFMIAVNVFSPDSDADHFTFSMFMVPLTLFSFWAADKWRVRAKELEEVLREFDE